MLKSKVKKNYWVYGPYLHKKEQRRYVNLVHKYDEHRTTMSYARFKVMEHLGRELTEVEEVDHIDSDCLNDSIDNLQILTKKENLAKRNISRTFVELTCNWCKTTFLKEKRQIKKNLKYPQTCSRKCSGEQQRFYEGQ